jgi:outer membrane protein assembly factor BamB
MGAPAINIGSVGDWAFSPDRCTFSKINSLGLHQLDLTQIDASGRPKTLWKTTSLSDASQVVAVGELLVQNTSGVLACLDSSSGQELWRGAAVGEGGHPVVLASGDILQTTWTGDVLRRSAKTG